MDMALKPYGRMVNWRVALATSNAYAYIPPIRSGGVFDKEMSPIAFDPPDTTVCKEHQSLNRRVRPFRPIDVQLRAARRIRIWWSKNDPVQEILQKGARLRKISERAVKERHANVIDVSSQKALHRDLRTRAFQILDLLQRLLFRSNGKAVFKCTSNRPVFDAMRSIEYPNGLLCVLSTAADGGSYAFLADQVIALNALNPQVAARMARGFDRWKRLDAARQAQAKAELERIRDTDGLSKDVAEIVTKALGG